MVISGMLQRLIVRFSGKKASRAQRVYQQHTSLNPQEHSPYCLIGTQYFENMGALQVLLQSAEGQAVADDVPNLATLVVGEV
jgi:hypothetical protein